MKMIYVCSPYRPTAGTPKLKEIQKERNVLLVKNACKNVAEKGYIPIAPHLYFTQFLDDGKPEERTFGRTLGIAAMDYCDELWIFTEGLISDGMLKEIVLAADLEIPVRMFEVSGEGENHFTENKHIGELVKSLKEAADAMDDAASFEEDSLPDEDAEKEGDEDGDYQTIHGLADVLDTIIREVVSFADNGEEALTIRIRK